MGYANFGTRRAREVVEVTDDVRCLDRGGFWAVAVTFEGVVTCVRFAEVTTIAATSIAATTVPATTAQATAVSRPAEPGAAHPGSPGPWVPLTGSWSSSLDEPAYLLRVSQIRDRIAAGEVYQVCLCRVMSHPLSGAASLTDLETLVAQGNPAPYASRLYLPEAGLDVLSASPEAFLIRHGGRIESRPIKGTATSLSTMLAKDYAENVMIADLVRNDLSVICRPGSVGVGALCAPQEHPGLTHLVTTVSGQLRAEVTWADVMSATFPPGSVSGAPKSSALQVIADLESVPRGLYCGALGWVDTDAGEAELAVGIRTFWTQRDAAGARWLRFGTGGAITWGSDPAQEWAETELKAARLIGLASGRVGP